MDNASEDMSTGSSADSDTGDSKVDSLCDAMESADCEGDTSINMLLLGECNLHFKALQEQYSTAFGKGPSDVEALDDWFIDECCDVFTGIMAGANECMTTDVIIGRMREIFEPFMQSGYLNDELLYEYVSRIFIVFHQTRGTEDMISALEDRYKGNLNDAPISSSDESSENENNPFSKPARPDAKNT